MQRMRGRQVCVTCDGGISQAAVSPDAPDTCSRCGSALSRRFDDEDIAFAERLRVHRRHIEDILGEFGEEHVVRLDATATRSEIATRALDRLAEQVPATP